MNVHVCLNIFFRMQEDSRELLSLFLHHRLLRPIPRPSKLQVGHCDFCPVSRLPD